MILTSLWIPNVPKIVGKTERKSIACGSLLLLKYESFLFLVFSSNQDSSDLSSTLLQNGQGVNIMKDFILSLIQLFTGETTGGPVDSNTYVDVDDKTITSSGFSALKMATKLPTDFYPSKENPPADFARIVKELMTRYGPQVCI